MKGSPGDPLPRLRADLDRILRAAVDAVEPTRLVRAALGCGLIDRMPPQSLFVVAAGKAAWSMASAFAEGEGPGIAIGLISGPRQAASEVPPKFQWLEGGHPWPDAMSERAGRRALAMAERSRAGGTLVVLLSGGASAMLAVPAGDLTLDDKARTARALMYGGVAIDELNCVRKHLSAIKGGRLAAAAARTITLAISDVHGPRPDDPSVIGSGPTVADGTTFTDALDIVDRAGCRDRIPAAALAHLMAGAGEDFEETPKPGDPRLGRTSYDVLANRHSAMEGAAREARQRGYMVHVIERATSGEAREAAVEFAVCGVGQVSPGSGPLCVIASGETTVQVRGDGRGGRNQEFALAAGPVLASAAASLGIAAALGSIGTDGIDGPTDAAGAVLDTSTAVRADRVGVSGELALARNGAYDFFEPLGDLVIWGPTGTNVGDVHVLVIA